MCVPAGSRLPGLTTRMSYLIDTDIIIYSLKGDPVVAQAFKNHVHAPKAISVITYGELAYGAQRSARGAANMARVRRVAEIFPVLDVTPGVVETYADVKSTLEADGTPLADLDLLIAATALLHGLTLVTNNLKHFARVPGLRVASWAREGTS